LSAFSELSAFRRFSLRFLRFALRRQKSSLAEPSSFRLFFGFGCGFFHQLFFFHGFALGIAFDDGIGNLCCETSWMVRAESSFAGMM
jgi:hypothetical protein